jgi:hypothetical protein
MTIVDVFHFLDFVAVPHHPVNALGHFLLASPMSTISDAASGRIPRT